MVRICIAVVQIDPIWMVRICIRRLESHSNASNTVRRAGIGILILWTPFNWLELAFECFECCSNGWNWHSNASNPVLLLQLAFECYESHSTGSNGWNWHLSASIPVRMVGIGIPVLRIPFEWLEYAFEWFESRSNGWNWHSNASIPDRRVGIGILIIRTPFNWMELAFECFECCSNGWECFEFRSNG